MDIYELYTLILENTLILNTHGLSIEIDHIWHHKESIHQ